MNIKSGRQVLLAHQDEDRRPTLVGKIPTLDELVAAIAEIRDRIKRRHQHCLRERSDRKPASRALLPQGSDKHDHRPSPLLAKMKRASDKVQ